MASPGIAVDPHGYAYVAAQGPNNSLMYYFSSGGGIWQSQMVAPAETTFSEPSIAVSANGNLSVYVVVRGPNSSLQYYYTPDGTQVNPHWYQQTVATGITTFSAPMIAVGPTGYAYIVARGLDDSLMYYFSAGGGQWTPQMIAGTGTTLSACITVGFTGSVYVAARALDDSLNYYYSADGTGANPQWNQQTISGPGTGLALSIAIAQDGTANVVVAASDLSFKRYSSFAGNPWYGQLTIWDKIRWDIGSTAFAIDGNGDGHTVSLAGDPITGYSFLLVKYSFKMNSNLEHDTLYTVPSQATVSSPAIALGLTGSRYVVAQGPNNTLMYFYSPGIEQQWYFQIIAGPDTTF